VIKQLAPKVNWIFCCYAVVKILPERGILQLRTDRMKQSLFEKLKAWERITYQLKVLHSCKLKRHLYKELVDLFDCFRSEVET